jgi:predicted metalloprotease with PDZ domain
MYASGFLSATTKNKTTDVLKAPDYVHLADNPVMYCKPDTTSLSVAGCEVKISVYSNTGVVKAEKVKEYLMPLATELNEFSKGLPVNEYHFLFYFDAPMRIANVKGAGLSGYGALEHNHSSFYYLPETKNEKDLRETLQHVCGHEFLHLVTPLNLHSKEIADFDFLNPKMSQHLWMYEGVTEYFSELVPLHGGMVTEKEFRTSVRTKVNTWDDFGAFSMTSMSANVITEENQKLYESVYSKGAVLAMLLDIQIADLTKGEKNLRTVMMELAKIYGPEKPFDDNQLFKDFVKLSHPDIQQFFDDYIIGNITPDMGAIFAKIGWDYAKEKKTDIYMSGNFGISFDESTSALKFYNVGNNIFGLQNGDELVSINWTDITADNLNEKFEDYFNHNESPNEISLVVKRNGVTKTLRGRPQEGILTQQNYIGPKKEPLTEAEIALRKLILHITPNAN